MPLSSLSILPLTIVWLAALIGQGALIKHDPSPLLQAQVSDTDFESRQNNYISDFQQYNQPQIIPNPSGYIAPRPTYQQNYAYRPEYHRYPPQPSRYPQLGQNINAQQNYYGGTNPLQNSQQQSFMDILETVAANDELQCVSKILCEMSSGRRQTSSSQQSFVNLESLLTLLSSVDDTTASPLVKFGKAFIVGYSSKHISQCNYAYPRCPSNPDRLIHYLNNQNGGIFRFFNGQNRRIQNYNPRDLFQNIYNMYSPLQDQVLKFSNNQYQSFPPINQDNTYGPSHEQILMFLHNQNQHFIIQNNLDNNSNPYFPEQENTPEAFRIRRGKSLKFPVENVDNKDKYFPFNFPNPYDSSNEVQSDTDNTIVFKYTK